MPGMFQRPPQPASGCHRCSLCGINFPNNPDKFKECPVCGEPTSFFSNQFVDEDWEDKAAYTAQRWDGDVDTLEAWLHEQDKKET